MATFSGRDWNRRQSIRLRGHDYAGGGIYFVTLCTYQRECLFGEISGDRFIPNAVGLAVEEEWVRSGTIRREVSIDVFGLMPNHLHALVRIASSVGAHGGAPGPRETGLGRTTRSLGSLIAGFKQASTIHINRIRNTLGATVWQRNYYEHIVRDDADFDRIAMYIVTNPERWTQDEEHPDAPRTTH
jgi:REP element-mobilizing transposase RayT